MKKVMVWLGLAVAVVAAMLGMRSIGYQEGREMAESEKVEVEDSGPTKTTVTRIIDGDTLELETKQRIRLNNLKAAEVGRCGYSQAKEKLEELALGKKVWVEGEFVDDFGRLLGLVYTDDYLVNLEMVRSGWARYDSNKTGVEEEMRLAGEKARENKLGVYGLCRTETENQECLIKGNNREGHNTKIYSFPGCKSYNNAKVDTDLGDQWFCSEKEAMVAGYVKGEDCFGKIWP